MSKKNPQSSEVVAPKSDEKETVLTPSTPGDAPGNAPGDAPTNPLDSKIATLTEGQKAEIAKFKAFVAMCDMPKVLNDAFKKFTQDIGLYETSANTEQIEATRAEIAKVKIALTSAGFTEDSPIVLAAIKGLVATLEKAEKDVKDNLTDLANYFKVKLAKGAGNRVYANNGDLAAKKMTPSEIKEHDYLFSQQDKKAVLIHSLTVAEADLAKLGVKASGDVWIAFEYNGLLSSTRNRSGDGSNWMLGDITQFPENWVKVHSVVATTGTLSNLMGVTAATLGLSYNGNGWQSNTMLNKKFDKVSRVVKA